MTMHSFEIRSTADPFAATEEQFADYLQDPLSSRKAAAAAMFCWHVGDWIYAESPKLRLRHKKKELFHRHITTECPSLQVMQDITNGTKHRNLKKPRAGIVKTKSRSGQFSPGEFDLGFSMQMCPTGVGSTRALFSCRSVLSG